MDFENVLPINTVQYLYNHPEILASYQHYLDQIRWNHKPSECLYKALTSFFSKYSKIPSKAEYYALITKTSQYKKATDSLKLLYKAAIKKVTTTDVDPATSERVLEFLMTEYLKDYANRTQEFLQYDNNFQDVAEFSERESENLRNISALTVAEQEESFRPFSSKGFNQINETLRSLSEHECIPIFSPRLTKLSGGGYRRRELSAVLGIMGRGKTTYLLANAKYTSYDLHRFCILITLDDSPNDIRHRLWKNLAGSKGADLGAEDLQTYVLENCEPNDMLEHVAFPRDVMTVNQIRYEIEKIVRRRKAEAKRKVESGEWTEEYAAHFCDLQLVVLDYADEIKTTNSQDQFRHRESGKFKALATMAYELDCAVLTATQSNRVGLDSNTLTLSNVSESLAKFNVCKFCVSLSASDGELNSGTMRIAIIKNNHGVLNSCVPMKVEWSTQRIEEDEKKAITTIQTKTTPRTEAPSERKDYSGLADKLDGSALMPSMRE